MTSIKNYELSNPQKRIWLTELVNNRQEMSNIGYLIELKGKYNPELLARAIKQVVKKNKGLQLNFKYTDKEKGDLVQYMPAYEEIDVEIIEAADEAELFQKIDELHRKQFDITGKYLCAFAVFSINNEKFGLFEKAHHLVADGISAVVVAREVFETYQKLEAGDFEETEKDFSYIDFLEAEKEYTGSEKYNKDKDSWLSRFEDFRGEEITFRLNKNIKNSLKVKRGNYRVPTNMIPLLEEYKAGNRMSNFPLFMAALAIYFNRCLNHEDMVIGMPVHNRSKKIFRNMVGMFVSTIPLRIKFEENWSFNDLAAYVKKELWEALKHQSYPYNQLVKDFTAAGIDASSLLNVQLIELPGALEDYIAKRAFFSTAYNISQLSIYLNQQYSPKLEDLEIAIDYHSDIFAPGEVDALFKRLAVIMAQCAAEPGKPISELSLLDEKEYNRLIFELNDTKADFPKDKTLPQLFAEQVLKNPGNIALEYEGQTVTYKELDELSGKLAAKLQQSGITPGSIVGLLCDRSIEAVLCILAVLKAGGAYLPIDPAYPLDRKRYIIENSGLKILLIEKVLEQQESELLTGSGDIKNILIDYLTLDEEKTGRDYEKPDFDSDSPAYVIYTSGTTGNPKGTLLRHRNVINYIWWGAGFYVGGEKTTFPLYTSLSFDLTVTSIFIPLVTGNTIVIYRDSKDGLLIERVVKENKVDICKLTPSHLKIIKELKGEVPKIRSFIVGGEELKTSTAREIDDYFGGKINIYNEYGPTETAVGCMIHRYDRNKDHDGGVPIGKPSNNVGIYILDKNKRPLPLGIIGEIYIGGAGVASGYHNNDALTAEKFVDNPFIPGEKMYRSGDLGRWNLDETLEFFGRCDEQVKIRGFRIEPGEIEKQLSNLTGVKDAVVVVVEDKSGQPSLCAYMVPDETEKAGQPEAAGLDAKTVRQALGKNLPDYMVPAYYVTIDKIPLTNNGKLDRRALPQPQVKTGAEGGLEPATDLEKTIGKIWCDVLAIEGIGMEDNFFDLGGDSIKAVQISSRLNDRDLAVNAGDILNYQTISQLILHVDFHKEKKTYEQGFMEGTKTLSPIEAWFFEQRFRQPHYFNQSALLEFETEIDRDILVKCFNLLIKHHDGLRLNVDLKTNALFYNNRHLEKDVEIETFDIPAGDSLEDKIRETGEKVKASFDLQNSLLIKAAIIKCGAEKPKLLITAHHLVIDGVSWRILLADLYRLYAGFSKGEEATLPAKTASLTDWAACLREYARQEAVQQEVSYWEEITGSGFSIAGDKAGDAAIGVMKDREKTGFVFDEEQTGTLTRGSRESFKTDVEVLLVTALGSALRDFSGSKEIVLEMENYGRVLQETDLSRTIGWFTAMYPKMIDMDKEDLTGRIKSIKEQLRATPNNGIGYGVLKYTAKKISENYQSQVRFNYLGKFDREISNEIFSYSETGTGSDIGPENVMTVPVEIDCMILQGRLIFDLYYSRGMFSQEKMAGLLEKIKSVLEQMVTYFETEDEVHFTPSDFDTVDLDEDDLEALFG
ncbi:MAG: amino acid adenylation domain-containing protein [Candidatus Aminicenantes bacterium]|nr:amino acid adenylation domain-containing protein [Candidatus Aminicenantes bacterium]